MTTRADHGPMDWGIIAAFWLGVSSIPVFALGAVVGIWSPPIGQGILAAGGMFWLAMCLCLVGGMMWELAADIRDSRRNTR